MKRGLLLIMLVCLVAAPSVAAAAVALPETVPEVHLLSRAPEWSARQVSFQPDEDAVAQLLRTGAVRVRQFPLPGGRWVDLDLMPFELAHAGTRFMVSDGAGVRAVSPPVMRFFRGQVAGEDGSLATLSIIDGRLAGFVRSQGRESTYGPPRKARGRAVSARVEVRDDAHRLEAGGVCDGDRFKTAADGPVDPGSGAFSMALDGSPSSIDGDTLLLAQVAVEGTVEWVTHHGGVAAAQAYTLNLMAQVSAIYEADLKVQLQVPWMLLHSAESDGYSGAANSTSTLLNEMVTIWNDTPSLREVFRTTAHLFSTYPSGGAGRAYVDVLCDGVPANSNSRDFGVSLLSGNGGGWERGLVAHELGHNFASPHTHCYQPPIDQCYGGQSGCYEGPDVASTGTIMSYCGNSLDTFHQRVRDEQMRPAAEAAFPSCMDVAGMPGGIARDAESQLTLAAARRCAPQGLVADPGSTSSSLGYSGTTRAAWMKRFTPACYPFRLNELQVRMSHSPSVAPGRPVQLLVYADAAGTGDPAMATLVHSEDTTVQVSGSGTWNDYTLASPVTLMSGDLYLGLYDLEADSGSTYIMDYSNSSSGDSWLQANGTSAAGYNPFNGGTWMIRGQGGPVPEGSLAMSWGQACNAAEVPNQDFAIYQGPLGQWNNLSILTCSTGRDPSWFIDSIEEDMFWLVVPQNSANEGSYGRSSFGERPPAAVPCRPQAVATCP